MPQLVEDLHEFATRHGGFENSLVVGGTRLFADGAKCDDDLGVMRQEPPADEYQCCLSQLQYVDAALNMLEPRFGQFKLNLETQAQTAAQNAGSHLMIHAPPQPQEIEQLQAMADKINALREKREAINEQLENTPEHKAQLEAARRNAEHTRRESERATGVLQQITNINIR